MNHDENETVDLRVREAGWKHAGTIGIDSASCWIGDPMYPKPEAFSRGAGPVPFENFPDRSDGLVSGVLVQTGWGDGAYPVYIRIDEETGRTVGVLIDFGMTDTQRRFFDDRGDL